MKPTRSAGRRLAGCSTAITIPITLIKLKELLEILEDASDKAEDVANVLETVVLKNALRRHALDRSHKPSGRALVSTGTILLIITVATALVFDFLNGFHDAANSIATVVSTRVLSPRLAVIWAAAFNFLAAFLLGTAVAKTIGAGMIRTHIVTQYVVLAGLAGAIVWDVVTWLLGLPTSSSHALIGGYAGAAMARATILHGWRAAPQSSLPAAGTRR